MKSWVTGIIYLISLLAVIIVSVKGCSGNETGEIVSLGFVEVR